MINNEGETFMKILNTIHLKACLLGMAVLVACGCSNEEAMVTGTGLQISLADDVDIYTRSTPAEIGGPVLSQFHLTIKEQGQTYPAYDDTYTSQFIPLSIGSYDLRASFGKNEILALDAPYYEGTATASVLTDQTTQATIPCQVANSLLSVKYSNPELFDELYSSYGVKVQVQNLSTVLAGTKNVSAYFRAGSTVMATFCATIKENGQEVSMPITSDKIPQPFAARDHAILKLSAKATTGGAILTVDTVEVEKVTITQTIPMEWLPKPKVSGFANGATSVTYTETADAVPAQLAYVASMPVQDVEFTLNFQDSQYAQLNKTYTLSTLSAEDKQALNNAGIALPSLDAVSKQGIIDFTNITPNLVTNAGATVVNSISLRVKANNRWSSDGSNYEIRTVRPQFTISVQPENIWADEFTTDEAIVSTGDANTIKSNLIYQYSLDGGNTWSNCNDNSNRRQNFVTLPSNRDCKVRANYKSMSSNIANATLEDPTQLPNSDMETWQINKLGSTSFFDGSKAFYDFLPYSSNDDTWWTTNSERGRGYSVARVQITSSSCVSCSENTKHGGSRSALLYTSGHGGNYVSSDILVIPAGAFAGSLFIGTYKWVGGDDNTEDITTGHSFDSRPRTFSFWYKYLPKGDDQFKAYVEVRNNSDVIATGIYIPTSTSTGVGM